MMRSRALPANFDMTHALHAPFGAPAPGAGTPSASPGSYAPFGNTNGARPLTLDTFKRVPEYQAYGQHYASPTGITPAIGGFAFTPPQSATDAISPSSATTNMSPFSFQTQESPRRHPFSGQVGQHAGHPSYPPQGPRLQIHDRLTRSIGETAGSPLRTSISYSGLGSIGTSQSQPQDRTQAPSEQHSYGHGAQQQSRSASNAGVTGSGPYGLGFSCEL